VTAEQETLQPLRAQVVVAAAFFAAGAMKLAAVPSEVQLFAQIGLGQWFRFVIRFDVVDAPAN
jgi:hypothetical protein